MASVSDGTLVEFHSFFLQPDSEHRLSAHFETGTREITIVGAAGENKTLEIEAPARTEVDEPEPIAPILTPSPSEPRAEDTDRKPLPPLVVYIGAGVTGALAVGAAIMTLGANGKVDDYESAVDTYDDCVADSSCRNALDLYNDAKEAQKSAKDAASLRNVLWIATRNPWCNRALKSPSA